MRRFEGSKRPFITKHIVMSRTKSRGSDKRKKAVKANDVRRLSGGKCNSCTKLEMLLLRYLLGGSGYRSVGVLHLQY